MQTWYWITRHPINIRKLSSVPSKKLHLGNSTLFVDSTCSSKVSLYFSIIAHRVVAYCVQFAKTSTNKNKLPPNKKHRHHHSRTLTSHFIQTIWWWWAIRMTTHKPRRSPSTTLISISFYGPKPEARLKQVKQIAFLFYWWRRATI